MLRNSMIGLVVFGLASAAAGYIWTAYEFPFAIVLPAAIGWYAVTKPDFGNRTALLAALVGGVSFTGAFLVAVFFALTDGSPIALTAWMSATLAAAVAGALTGWVMDRMRGAGTMAMYSAAGMLLATTVSTLMRAAAPASVDVEGATQYAYFALVIGVVGAIVGVAVGAGSSWLAERRGSPSRHPLDPVGPPRHA